MLLRLYKGYKIFVTKERTTKLTKRYVGPFRIIRGVGKLAYQLEIATSLEDPPSIYNSPTGALYDPRPI